MFKSFSFFWIISIEVLIFSVDLITPLGTIEWIYYLLPVFLGATGHSSIKAYLNLIVVSLFMLFGLLLSPEGIDRTIAISNRILGELILLGFTFLLLRYREAQIQLREKEVLERTSMELKELNNQLRESNFNKDKLFTIISHDLRSPFTALLGFSEFLAHNIEEMSQEEVREFAERIYKSSNKLLKLIENLLHWSRFQTGKISYSPHHFSFTDLVSEITEIYQINLVKKKISLCINGTEELFIFADRDMISLVLRNLVSNAIKYSHQYAYITLEYIRKDDHLIFEISDEGVGIAEENLQGLFNYDQMKSTPGAENEPGTGLGLVLCKEFINLNKGKIWVQSIPGKGSKFGFSIPLTN